MEDLKRLAEVHYSTEGPVPVVELVVPHGTRLLDLLKAQETVRCEKPNLRWEREVGTKFPPGWLCSILFFYRV